MVTCPANGVDVYAQFNNGKAVFQDNVQSYSTVEPAIDLTASSPLAFAWLSWSQLTDLATAGNEIASHTVDHVNLKKLKLADARFQVCQDRVNLANHGFQAESLAYPFGDFDSTVETQVVQYCGDNSGRGVSGVTDRKVFAETIPPADPFATRTPADPKQGTTVATIEGYVTAAENNGGGWVQLT
jgi:peptidoglycan/xylan/chitin deacetylase (PgdA/CDA1 family)